MLLAFDTRQYHFDIVVILTFNFDSRNIYLIITCIPYVTTPTILLMWYIIYTIYYTIYIEINIYFIYKLSLEYTSSFGLNKLKIMHDI